MFALGQRSLEKANSGNIENLSSEDHHLLDDSPLPHYFFL